MAASWSLGPSVVSRVSLSAFSSARPVVGASTIPFKWSLAATVLLSHQLDNLSIIFGLRSIVFALESRFEVLF